MADPRDPNPAPAPFPPLPPTPDPDDDFEDDDPEPRPKFRWGRYVVITLIVIGSIVAGIFTFRGCSNHKKEKPAPAPVTEKSTELAPWEALKGTVIDNSFFRCKTGDGCRGYIIRGEISGEGTKVTGIMSWDESFTVTTVNGTDNTVTLVYQDENGDGVVDKISGDGFPGPASVNKMPTRLRKEAEKKYEAHLKYLKEVADGAVENALFRDGPKQ